MNKGASRFIDDVRRFPVDGLARRVTAPAPAWCTPGPSEDLDRAMPAHAWAGAVGRLYRQMDPERRRIFTTIVRRAKVDKWQHQRALACYMLGITPNRGEAKGLAKVVRFARWP